MSMFCIDEQCTRNHSVGVVRSQDTQLDIFRLDCLTQFGVLPGN